MSEEAHVRSMRKGTKSCLECRRRKLRCSWTSDDAEICRRCEERGLNCIPQTPSSSISEPKRTSKDRITKLEGQVSQLSRALRVVESRLKIRRPPTESAPSHNDHNEDEAEDEETSANDEVVTEEAHTRMHTLFQNEWLSTDIQPTIEQRRQRHDQTSLRWLAAAREALQELIPAKEDVVLFSHHIAQWSSIVADMFPASNLAPVPQEVLARYEEVIRPDTDTWMLAAWLLALALTAQQIPQDEDSPGALVNSVRQRYSFARTVADTVERSLLSHDSLLGTVQGLETALQFLRVTLLRGSLQKTWLYLRRTVSVAELMGLPRIARAYEQRVARGQTSMDDFGKNQIWASLCAVDRLCGMLFNLPMSTRAYRIPFVPAMRNDGSLSPTSYLLRLSDVAVGIQDLDDLRVSSESANDLYAQALKLDSDLRTLGATMPAKWLSKVPPSPGAGNILLMVHLCFTMQVHLPFVLKDDPSRQFTYSKMAGIRACQDLSRQWQQLRRVLPFGFFLCRIMDVQAFTATVILLFVSHSERYGNTAGLGNPQELDTVLAENVGLLEAKSREPFCPVFTRQAVSTLHSLAALLQGHSDSTGEAELTLQVPLIGRIRVKPKAGGTSFQTSPQNDLAPTSWLPSQQPMVPTSAQFDNDVGMKASHIGVNEGFSWMIEDDYGPLFQDFSMTDDADALQQWQAGFA